jgi:hypothetical protein
MSDEEEVVAELEGLGVRYLSRQSKSPPARPHAPDELLADLVRQPSSRVRAAFIALLLARPDYATYAPAALKTLSDEHAQTFKFFYTAAVCLQEQYTNALRPFVGADWQEIPDRFSNELGVSGDSPGAQLNSLANQHAQWSGVRLNWAGTYQNAVRKLLRRWEVEKRNQHNHV